MSELLSTPSLALFPDLPQPVAEGRGRIRPRARLLRTIGAELISSEVVAVIELVRNSYDADATQVDIVFHHPEDPERATLEIRDNGHGMSREILLGPWLEPATDYKSGSRTDGAAGQRSPAGRRRLGSKGVGRFAAQRLGTKLELRTRAMRSVNELIARFDWSALERDQYLDQVRVPWREGAAEHIDAHGTHLRISGLRDRWSPDRFEKLKLGLSRMVSPTMREQFQIQIVINGASEEVRPTIDANQAMYSIRGSVNAEGHCVIHYEDINGDGETWERSAFWPQEAEQKCGPLEFRINAWDLDREPLKLYLKQTGSKLGLRDFRKLVRDHSGISLYRDGFRILPYGEPDNDWLRLDRRRVNNPTMRLSNNQVLGTIQLTADENPHLKDQTNREGLVTNEAYNHLSEVVLELLGYLETRRFAARRSMDIDWQRRTTSLPDMAQEEGASRLDEIVGRLAGDCGDKAESAKQLRLEIKEFRQSTADAVRHYAGMAASGQMAGLVFRQLGHPLRQMKSDLGLAASDLESGELDEEDREDILMLVRKSLKHLRTMEKRMATLDPLAVGGRGRRVSDQKVREVLNEVLDAFEGEFYRHAVVPVFEKGDSVVRTNREVAQQVFANLLENAVHHAALTEEPTAMVTVRVTETGFSIANNGPAIPEQLVAAIFEPHFSTRDGAHGLGLTLVRDLLKTVGGRIYLADRERARFVVSFR